MKVLSSSSKRSIFWGYWFSRRSKVTAYWIEGTGYDWLR